MKINLEIDEAKITALVEAEIVRQILHNENFQKRAAVFGVREGTDKAVKAYIYSNKDEIIERVVERASREIVRKGLPKLIENIKGL